MYAFERLFYAVCDCVCLCGEGEVDSKLVKKKNNQSRDQFAFIRIGGNDLNVDSVANVEIKFNEQRHQYCITEHALIMYCWGTLQFYFKRLHYSKIIVCCCSQSSDLVLLTKFHTK